jgi:isoleucyl-tRNA synthetase
MDAYTTPALIKEFEIFVDDISNWYIRSNRRRFWKEGDNEDKMIAYWTLFNALNNLIKVMAPIIPFMTEHIWQNLTRKVLPDSEISVHLADWPVPDERFKDDGIIEQTALSREVIASALRLRNEKQIKVRQPLATLFVCLPAEKAEKIKVFEKNILDELNIREIKYLTDKSVLEDSYLQVNFRAAGAVFKQDVNKFKAALENMDAQTMSALAEKVKNGENTRVDGFDFDIAPDLYVLNSRTKEGIVSAEFSEDGVLALDTALTDELLKDGAVRDVIRQCQLIRKEAGYVVDQRVRMAISTDDEFILNALKEKEDYLLSELLCDELVFNGSLESDLEKEIEVNDKNITLAVAKA